MIRILQVVPLLVCIIVLSAQPTGSIVNKRRNASSRYPPRFYPRREYFKRKSYLEADRPLWVLEDKVTHPGEIEIATHRPFKSKRRFISPGTFRPKLPSHYSNLNSASLRPTGPQSMPRNHKRTQTFPVFDDFELDSEPILIYRGPKAEMIFNTMMTNRQYPMNEPVPGQVMYPPYSPKFKPTPVVERVRTDTYPKSVFQNVTLIPFYAHEAIGGHYKSKPQNLEAPSDASEEVVNNYLTDEEDHEPARYHSYYSQDDVQAKYWSMPYTTPSPPDASTSMTLNRQLAVPDGIYSNHRMEATTTPMPRPTDDSFRIMYTSENENPPPKHYKSVHTAKYGGFKTIYPVYTLNKLLKYKPVQKPSRRSLDFVERKLKPSPGETWLIWDSRHTSHYLNSMSSKMLPKSHQTSATLDTKILVQ